MPSPIRVTAAGLPAVLLILSGTPAAASAQRTETVLSEAVSAGTTLRLATATGEIDVRPASGSTLEVTGVAREEDRRIVFEVARDGNEIIVCALREDIDTCSDEGVQSHGRWNDRGDDSRGDLRVLLPAGVALSAASGNGPVHVEDAGSDVSAASGNGRVEVLGAAGEVSAASGNGAVTVERAGGPVDASSGNGKVVVSTARGPVSASSGNGDIKVDIASLSGDAAMAFSSGNGTIELTLPADFRADLVANLGNGEVESDFPLVVEGRLQSHRMEARIGGGGPRLRVSSGNGDLVLRRR